MSSGLNQGDNPSECCNAKLLGRERQVNAAGLPELYENPTPVDLERYTEIRLRDTAKHILEGIPRAGAADADYSPDGWYASSEPVPGAEDSRATGFHLTKYNSIEQIEKLIQEHPAAVVYSDGRHWQYEGSPGKLARFDFVEEYRKAYPLYADPMSYEQHFRSSENAH